MLWLYAILVILQDVMKEDKKKIRAGFPMHHATLTEITTIKIYTPNLKP